MSAQVHPLRGSRHHDLPMPESIEAEQELLGALLLNNSVLSAVSPYVSAQDFGEHLHRRVFDVAATLIGEGKSASPATLRPFLGDHDLGDGVTVPVYLARLCACASAITTAPGHARIVRDLAARRDLVAAAAQLDERARSVDVRVDPATIAASSMLDLQAVAAAASSDTARHASEYADEIMQLVDDVRSGKVENQIVTTGYSDLDRAMNGLNPQELIVVAGRPGMGKTAIMNSIAWRTARAGNGVLEFPLEVGHRQLIARHLADAAYRGTGSASFRDIGNRAAQLSEGDVTSLREAHKKFRALPIQIDRRSRVTVAQISAKIAQIKRAMAANGDTLRVCMLDHLDYVLATDRYAGNRTQEIGEICIGLKDIARSQDVCIVLFCQLNRDVEKRQIKDRRPTLADLRNSGDIEQVADVVMFVYRPEYYLTRSSEFDDGDAEAVQAALAAKGKLELVLAKVRSGPTPIIRLWCDMAASSISSFERGRS